jgi:hypothetical protein
VTFRAQPRLTSSVLGRLLLPAEASIAEDVLHVLHVLLHRRPLSPGALGTRRSLPSSTRRTHRGCPRPPSRSWRSRAMSHLVSFPMSMLMCLG